MTAQPQPADAEQLEQATTLLRDFATAMARWEKECSDQDRANPPERLDPNEYHAAAQAMRASCQKIFDRYCTDRPRGNSRPATVCYGYPSEYAVARFSIDRAEFDISRRIYIYTTRAGALGPFRFTIVKKKDGLRIDARQAWVDRGWAEAGL